MKLKCRRNFYLTFLRGILIRMMIVILFIYDLFLDAANSFF
jgi:hypothetical protein